MCLLHVFVICLILRYSFWLKVVSLSRTCSWHLSKYLLSSLVILSKWCLSILVTGLSHWKSSLLRKRTCNFNKIRFDSCTRIFSRNLSIIAIFDKLIEKLMFSINVVQTQFFRNYLFEIILWTIFFEIIRFSKSFIEKWCFFRKLKLFAKGKISINFTYRVFSIRYFLDKLSL